MLPALTALAVLSSCGKSGDVGVTAIALNKSTSEIAVGATENLKAIVRPYNASNKAVSWQSNDHTIATVTGEGTVTAKAQGVVEITATTFDGGKSASCIVTVVTPIVTAVTPIVTAVTLDITSASMIMGETLQLAATVLPDDAEDKSVSWTSSDASVAEVSVSGMVTAKNAGAALITVTTAQGSYAAECIINVSNVITLNIVEGGSSFDAVITPQMDLSSTPAFAFGDDTVSAIVPAQFIVARSETTYRQWSEVYQWATAKAAVLYTFANPGVRGAYTSGSPQLTDQNPVSAISWRDAMVWCNALTEYYNANNGSQADLTCVYYSDAAYTAPIRNSLSVAYASSVSTTGGSFDRPYILAETAGNSEMSKCTATGFRLPTSVEWDFAARYIGMTEPTVSPLNTERRSAVIGQSVCYLTPGFYASGAAAGTTDVSATGAVAWYGGNSESTTHEVCAKSANMLGLFDMSGNLSEYCFDWFTSDVSRVTRGGSFSDTSAANVMLGAISYTSPYGAKNYSGFRFVRKR